MDSSCFSFIGSFAISATLRIHTVYKDGSALVLIKKFFIYHTCTKAKGVAFDPEGIMSTLPAIVEVIFGYVIGDYIQRRSKVPENLPPGTESNSGPYICSVVCLSLVLRCFLQATAGIRSFLSIKRSGRVHSQFILQGLATITIATMIYLIEYKNKRGLLTKFFDVFGKNALFVFALSAFLPRTLALIRIPDHLDNEGKMAYITPWSWLYHGYSFIPGDPRIGSLAYAICVILFMWFVCWWLDK